MEKALLTRLDSICARKIELEQNLSDPEIIKNHQKFIDCRVNPGEIHYLTLDSSKRIVRMLKKSELVFRAALCIQLPNQ